MKILAVSDEEAPFLWDYYEPGRLADYDLIISCGDLKSDYLQFLVTMARCPLLYVHGNHDIHYTQNPPLGCDCIEDRIVIYRGYRILGLGGCRYYHPGEHQYSEVQMRRRIRKLRTALRRTGGVDIVVTHAPPAGVGDASDPAHLGFQALLELLDRYKPQYLLHGHIHQRYGTMTARELTYGSTSVINVSERYELGLPDRPYPDRLKHELLWHPKPPKDLQRDF